MDQITVSASVDQVREVTSFVNERLEALEVPNASKSRWM